MSLVAAQGEVIGGIRNIICHDRMFCLLKFCFRESQS